MKNKAKLSPKKIRDKNGKLTTVWVKTESSTSSPDKLSAEEIVKEAQHPEGKYFGKDTSEIFYQDGKLTNGRSRLHADIISNHFKGHNPTKGKITSVMMGGAPASGKSSVVDGKLIEMPSDLVHIDADKVKKQIPEYQLMESQGNAYGASFTHRESSEITNQVLKKCADDGYGVLLDGTGNKSYEHMSKRVKLLKAAGHRVVANYVTMDTELSLKLNKMRFKATKRMVPESYVKAVNKGITPIVLQAIKEGLFDELRLFDTNIQNKPRKILTFANGKLDIHDKKLYEAFLKKAEE